MCKNRYHEKYRTLIYSLKIWRIIYKILPGWGLGTVGLPGIWLAADGASPPSGGLVTTTSGGLVSLCSGLVSTSGGLVSASGGLVSTSGGLVSALGGLVSSCGL